MKGKIGMRVRAVRTIAQNMPPKIALNLQKKMAAPMTTKIKDVLNPLASAAMMLKRLMHSSHQYLLHVANPANPVTRAINHKR